MKNLLLTTAFSLAFAAPVFASGAHSGGHDEAKVDDPVADYDAMMLVGTPGKAEDSVPAPILRTPRLVRCLQTKWMNSAPLVAW